MTPTSLSLLDRLKMAGPDASDWNRLLAIYQPLIERWLARIPGVGQDAADLTQDVLVVVAREISRFDRRREGSFRAWLRTVTVNRVRNHRRRSRRLPIVGSDPAERFLKELSDPEGNLARQWDAEHDRHVVDALMAVVQSDFQPTTWEAFRRFGMNEEPAARVAAELGISENAVILAKARVLKRLRAEGSGLLE